MSSFLIPGFPVRKLAGGLLLACRMGHTLRVMRGPRGRNLPGRMRGRPQGDVPADPSTRLMETLQPKDGF